MKRSTAGPAFAQTFAHGATLNAEQDAAKIDRAAAMMVSGRS